MRTARATAAVLVLSGCLEPTPGYQSEENASSGGTGSAGTTVTGDDGSSVTGTLSDPDGSSADGGTSSSGTTSSGGTGTAGTGGNGTSSSGTTGSSGGTGNPGEHLIFATSTSYGADFGGLEAADGICQSHADGVALPGTFVALLSSTAVAAKDRVTVNGTIVNMPGQIIAVDEADLWDGAIQNTVAFDENGNEGPGVTWTGTLADGSIGDTCDDWTSIDNATYGSQGNIRMSNAYWVESPDRCFKVKRFYCISQ